MQPNTISSFFLSSWHLCWWYTAMSLTRWMVNLISQSEFPYSYSVSRNSVVYLRIYSTFSMVLLQKGDCIYFNTTCFWMQYIVSYTDDPDCLSKDIRPSLNSKKWYTLKSVLHLSQNVTLLLIGLHMLTKRRSFNKRATLFQANEKYISHVFLRILLMNGRMCQSPLPPVVLLDSF